MLDDEHDRDCTPAAAGGGLARNRDFLKLWVGETVSDFGSRMGDVAVSFAAVITLGATPMQMGLLSAARTAPALAFSLAAGVWADRVRRRPMMIAADLGRAVLLATVPAAAVAGWLTMTQLYGVILAVAALDIFFSVAYRAYLPSIVAHRDLISANSRLTASSSVAEVAGFGLCGWLVQWLTAPFAILVDAITFVVSALAIGAIATTEAEPERDARAQGFIAEMAAGGRALLAEPSLVALGASAAVAALSWSIFSALYMIFAVTYLGFSPGVLGVIIALGGGSALLGALAAAPASRKIGAGRAMVAGLAIEGIALMLVPMARGHAAAAIALLAAQQLLGDGAATVYLIGLTTLVQTIAPPAMLGRVNATISFASLAASLAGALLGGAFGATIGLRPAMVLGAAMALVAAALLAVSPVWRIRAASAGGEDRATVTGAAAS